MIKSIGLFLLSVTALPSISTAQQEEERYFDSAGVAIRLIDPDSVTLQVTAGTEDLFNTVGVFPSSNSGKEVFRLYEKKIEAYFQGRLPLKIDGRRIHLNVVQWKPDGKGRSDGFDSSVANSKEQSITLGGMLPKRRQYLTVQADIWTERDDAAETVVKFSFFHGDTLLRQLWSRRENALKFPLSPDSLAAMKKIIHAK